VCPACGKALDDAKGTHQSCLGVGLPFHQAFAPLAYTPPLVTIIHKLKYDGYFGLARPLAEILVDAWPCWENSPDLIMPIPLHARRLKTRGFNQSALLARHLAAEAGIPVDENALQRVRHTVPQVGLNPEERHRNVTGAFASDSATVRHLHIVLVDDVFTTGATMRAAASSLIESGAATVSAYCLARTAG
jgi:ComF family protein